MQTLHALRHLYFISSRLGPNSFSAHVFVFLTSIDILSVYPKHVEAFLTDIQPHHLGQLPAHPLDRTLDHFFLNTAEHFTLVLPSAVAEDLLVAAANPYLNSTTGKGSARPQANLAVGRSHENSEPNSNLREIFEAAHSVALAVLSAPQNVELAARIFPFYIDALLNNLPPSLSPRQFRLAFKTLVRIASPPSALAGMQPDLAATILELLRHRALHSQTPSIPTSPILQSSAQHTPLTDAPRPSPSSSIAPPIPKPLASSTHPLAPASNSPPLLSPNPASILPPPALPAPPPQTTHPSRAALLTSTIIDSLPYIPFDLLEEWLPLTASLIRSLIESDHHSSPQLVEDIPRPPFSSNPASSTAAPLAEKQPSTGYYPTTNPIHNEDIDQDVNGDINGETCLQRFWEVLSSGEMDVDRAQVCVAWWTTRGGRELLLFGEDLTVDVNTEAQGEEPETNLD